MSANRMLAGVWLTGFDKVHWLLFVPIVFSTLAGISGFCINLWLWKKLGFREQLQCSTGKGS